VCGEIAAEEHWASIGGGWRGPVTAITPSLIQSSSLVFGESVLNYVICINFRLQKNLYYFNWCFYNYWTYGLTIKVAISLYKLQSDFKLILLYVLTLINPECNIRISWMRQNPLSEITNGKSVMPPLNVLCFQDYGINGAIMPFKLGMFMLPNQSILWCTLISLCSDFVFQRWWHVYWRRWCLLQVSILLASPWRTSKTTMVVATTPFPPMGTSESVKYLWHQNHALLTTCVTTVKPLECDQKSYLGRNRVVLRNTMS
jgi:hypothetical protein